MRSEPDTLPEWLDWWGEQMLATGRPDAASAVNAAATKVRQMTPTPTPTHRIPTLTTEREAKLWCKTLIAVARAGDGVSDGEENEGYAIDEADAAVWALRLRLGTPLT